MIEMAVFALLAVLTIVPAALVVTVKNIFHAALFLVLSLTGVAGFFAMLGADFLFVVQILLYAGGITVILLFVVLLSGSPKDWLIRQMNEQWLGALAASAVFVAVLAGLFQYLPGPESISAVGPTTELLGVLLLREMVLPFEAVSLVLLAALVGAVLFTRRGEGK
ncbi:MAG TPA: NADH-quinone oxidoreductase subunit J [Elusimicrobiota bacterium]|nr:NADH-quinone oxidoreductase subunit J [Elusimicrobiota bacterium]